MKCFKNCNSKIKETTSLTFSLQFGKYLSNHSVPTNCLINPGSGEGGGGGVGDRGGVGVLSLGFGLLTSFWIGLLGTITGRFGGSGGLGVGGGGGSSISSWKKFIVVD